MSAERVRGWLLWCTLIHYGILAIWFLFFVLAHERIYLLHSGWFSISMNQFDMIHYAAMAIYKIGVLLFNLVPLVACHLVGGTGSA